jgi:hypothetical protein
MNRMVGLLIIMRENRSTNRTTLDQVSIIMNRIVGLLLIIMREYRSPTEQPRTKCLLL